MSEVIHLGARRNARHRWRALITYRTADPAGYFVERFFDEFEDLGEAIADGPNFTCIVSISVVPNGLLGLSNLTVEEAARQ